MKKLFLIALFVFTAIFSTPLLAQDTDVDPEGGGSCLDIKNNLRYRSTDSGTNGEVSALQDFLQENNYLQVSPSGFLGLATVKAVKGFQSANRIAPTGYVGPTTRAKIKNISCDENNQTQTTSTNQTKPYLREYVSGPFVQLITQLTDEIWEFGKTYEIRWNHIYTVKGNLHVILTSDTFNSQGKIYCDLGFADVGQGFVRVDPNKISCKMHNSPLFNTIPSGKYKIELYDEQITPTIKGGYTIAISSGTITIPTATTASPVNQSPYINTNLEIGMTGNEVLKLQKFLATKGWLTTAPTGSFDFETKKAVIAYQLTNTIEPSTGYVGPLTRELINSQMISGSVTPTIPTTVEPSRDEASYRAYTFSIEALGGNSQLTRINMQASLINSKGETINPATVIKSFVLRDGNTILTTIPINTSSFTNYGGLYYMQLTNFGFNIPKDSRKNLNIDIVIAKPTDTYSVKFQTYGATGLRFVDDSGVSSFYGTTETSTGTLTPASIVINPVTAQLSVRSSVIPSTIVPSPATPTSTATTATQTTTGLPDPTTTCPQSVVVGTVTYTLGECTLDLTMTDGAGNKDFTIKVIPSDINKSFGFTVYGYGEGLPAYGALGTASGGARGITIIDKYLNDAYLNNEGTVPKIYTGYFKINIYENGEYNKYFLYQNFKVTLNPKVQ